MDKSKVTKGVPTILTSSTDSSRRWFTFEGKQVFAIQHSNSGHLEADANDALIAEAFTVFSETGMTPKEMQDTLRKVRIQLQLIMHGTAEESDDGAHENAYGLAKDALNIIGPNIKIFSSDCADA